MIGTMVSHYRILEKLGEGGMGVVYKAHDTRLDRIIALKFLPHHLTATAEDEARLLREARAAAALDHPNICTIFEVNDVEVTGEGRQTFLAMAYVEGETLQEKIKASMEDGGLKIEDVREIAIQAAEGLQAAHEKGIVHRDIKSANIIVTPKGQVKIMDFGLATAAGRTQLTIAGTTLGTVAYMSPEQARGDAVDQRTDIWALGIVIYEMLSGKMPFSSDYEQAVIYSILNENPKPLRRFRPEVTVDLEEIVQRCLQKAPAERYQSADEVCEALGGRGRGPGQVRQPGAGAASAQPVVADGAPPEKRMPRRTALYGMIAVGAALLIAGYFIFRPLMLAPTVDGTAGVKLNSLAVMYFDNQSGDKDLAKSLVNMLTTNLARDRDLSVVSDQHLFDILKILGKQDVQVIDRSVATEIAHRAQVRYVLLGSIISIGNRMRITAQLEDVQSGEIVGSDQVDGTLGDDVLAMADSLTERVRRSLHLSGVGGQPLRIADVTTASYQAYVFYQKGLEHLWRWETEQAADDFAHAVALDSTFALAHLEWAVATAGNDLLFANPLFDVSSLRSSMGRAKANSAKATAKEREFIDAYAALFKRDYQGANTLARALVDHYPNDKETNYLLSWTSWFTAKYDDMIRASERTLEIDPTFALGYNSLAYAYSYVNDYDKAVSAVKKLMALPYGGDWYDSAVEIFISAGRFDEADKLCREKLIKEPKDWGMYMYQSYIFLFQGDGEKAQLRMGQVPSVEVPLGIAKQKVVAWLYLHEGRYREAQQSLRKAVAIAHNAKDSGREIRARFDLGMLLTVQEEYGAALDQYSQAKILSTMHFGATSTPYLVMADYLAGMTFVKKGDLHEARARAATIASVVKTTRADNTLLDFSSMLLAESALAEGDGKAADAALRNVSAITRSNFPRAVSLKAAVHGLNGDMENAISGYKNLFNKIHTRNNYDGGDHFYYFRERSLAYYNIARSYEFQGNNGRAIEYYSLALEQWKHADTNMPELIDAKARLSRLGVKK